MKVSQLKVTITPRFNIYVSAFMVYCKLPVSWAFKVEGPIPCR